MNLLNANWGYTTAAPHPEGGWTLPGQALAVFLEGSWDELNRPFALVIELLDDEGQPAHFRHAITPDGETNPTVHIEQEVAIPPIPGAPNGTPGQWSLMLELPPGALAIAQPRARYIWRITGGTTVEEVGFWVHAPAQAPTIGQSGPASF